MKLLNKNTRGIPGLLIKKYESYVDLKQEKPAFWRAFKEFGEKFLTR